MILRSCLTTIILLLFVSFSFGQKIEENLTFSGESDTKTINIDVPSNASNLVLEIEANISEGALYISMTTPDGETENYLSLVTSGDGESGVQVENVNDDGSVSRVITSKSGSGASVVVTSGDQNISIGTGSGKGESSTITINSNTNSNSNTNKNKDKDKEKYKVKSKGKSKSTVTSYAYSTSDSSDDKGAKGVIAEVIGDPVAGTWTLEIKTEGAVGEAEIEVKTKN